MAYSDSSAKEAMIKNLTCPICCNLFISPVISACCSNTFCVSCVGKSSKCPLHKKVSGFTPNRAVEQMVESIPFNCPCGETVLRRDRRSHEDVCEMAFKTCKGCNFTGNLADRIAHILDKHADAVVNYYSEIV